MAFSFALATVTITAASLVVTAIAVRGWWRARRLLGETRLELIAVLERIDQAETSAATLETQIADSLARLDRAEALTASVQRLLERYRRTLAIHGPLGSRRVQ
jgi:hypothetical protein